MTFPETMLYYTALRAAFRVRNNYVSLNEAQNNSLLPFNSPSPYSCWMERFQVASISAKTSINTNTSSRHSYIRDELPRSSFSQAKSRTT